MKIIILDENHPILIEKLEKQGFSITEAYNLSKSDTELIISEFDGLIVRSRFPIDKTLLNKAKNLKFIGRVGAGLENIDTGFAEEKNIQLFNAPEGNRDAVAEHAMAMLLYSTNRIGIANNEVKNGLWKREENRGIEIKNRTIGLIGYGNMGKAFAQRLSGFKPKEVLCYDLLPNVGDENARQVSLEELQEKSEILSLHTPLTSLTEKIVDSIFIQKFKKPFYFINTARGKSVVTQDLVQAIKEEKILGAALDVLEYEKSSFENIFSKEDNPSLNFLIKSDKVVLTPHIAGWTQESKVKLAETIANKIIANFKV